MQSPHDSIGLLSMFTHPAFQVNDGIITDANQAALDLNIAKNTPVYQILESGKEEYSAFTGDTMSLTVKPENAAFLCAVVRISGGDIFHILSETDSPELRSMALAAQYLRDPLTNIFVLTDRLFSDISESIDPVRKRLAAQLNQNLHRLLRTIGNMSDTGTCADRTFGMETVNIPAVLSDALAAAQYLLETNDRRLLLSCCDTQAYGLADRSLLERVVFNMISNAVKYSPAGSTIQTTIQATASKVQLIVENECQSFTPELAGSIFFRYRRTPSVADGRTGLGLGVPFIQAVASLHKGSVLLTLPKPGSVRFCLTIPVRIDRTGALRSPVLRSDSSGGHDHGLIELSDVLTADSYY